MGKVVIYGGTFDPVTVEHISVCKNLSLIGGVEKVIVVPTFIPPHKKFDGASAIHRVNMLKIALSSIDKVEISLWETEQQRACYTYQTVKHFADLYPDKQLYFAMGTDMLLTFSSWKNPEQILKYASVMLIKRTGGGDNEKAKNDFLSRYGEQLQEVSFVGGDVSSTELKIRKWLELPFSDFTEQAVCDYIQKNNLYPKNRFYDYICQVLPEKRRRHTAGVIVCGIELAKKTGADVTKTEIACLLHDNAKYLDYKKYPFFEYCEMPKNVIHQFLGASVAEHILGIGDTDILNAIRYHTTARPNMSLLEKIVFTADVIEKGRTYGGVERLRAEVEKDFENGFCECIVDLYRSLCERDGDLYYLTLEAYNYYKDKVYGK